jgi:GntR family transcriptional regulator
MKKNLPKYFKIAQKIIDSIRCGDITPGVQISSENQIMESCNVSNTTARKVHQELERTGWVVRIKGKGTYVSDSRVDRSATRILGFTRNMLEAGRKPSTRLISAKLRNEGHSLEIGVRRYTLPSPMCEITRLRLADDVPVMRETRYISTELCPGIEKKDLEQSLYDIYEQEYGLQLDEVDQRLSAIVIDNKDGKFPGISEQTPGFLVEGVTFCAKELILELEESIYRGDMYRFSVRATR